MLVDVAGTWLSIRVELIEGGGDTIWPRPGRVFAAARTHSFARFATAIDDAFARWDRAHLYEFEMDDRTRVGPVDGDDPQLVDAATRTLGTLQPGEQFAYVFDLGDRWAHLCTVDAAGLDPLDLLGTRPRAPLPYWGWGSLPDQYGRRFDGDDGETDPPPDPALADLPALRPCWGTGT